MTEGSDALNLFREKLNEVLIELAQLIVRDGEGATKFISIAVNGGASEDECRDVAYTIGPGWNSCNSRKSRYILMMSVL